MAVKRSRAYNVPEKVQEIPYPEDANERSKKDRDDGNVIQKIKDELKKLPSFWLDRPTMRALLGNMLAVDDIKFRLKKYGLKSFASTILPYKSREYFYSLDTILSILAPNTKASGVMHTVRNVVLLDSMVDEITGKIERSSDLTCIAELNSYISSLKDFPYKLSDYYIDQAFDVSLAYMFLREITKYPVGAVVELKSPWFVGKDRTAQGVIHCKLEYKKATPEEVHVDHILRSTQTSLVAVCDIPEYGIKLLARAPTSPDPKDITIRRLFSAGTQIYGMYSSEADAACGPGLGWAGALPFSLVDFDEFAVQVVGATVATVPRSYLRRKTAADLFDEKSDALVKRILHADQMGCSRSYALVGIPGTGKSFIMNKVANEVKDAAIILPCFPEDGITVDARLQVQNVIEAVSVKHVFILLDDFDKYLADELSNGRTSSQLILLFEFLHSQCPGGVDENGNVKKTFTLIATMNNPTILSNAIIKRSERFDEVIDIGLPDSHIYGKRLNMLKDADDKTDFTSLKFRLAYRYMRKKIITLADIGNIYAIMKTHRNKDCVNCTYGVRDLLYAVKCIRKNRTSASKEYEI